MDNYFRQSFFSLDPVSCLSLADHMEAHAKVLRRHAETIDADRTAGLRKQMRIKRASKLAHAQSKTGSTDRSSVFSAAMAFRLPIEVVKANFERLQKKQAQKDLIARNKKIISLSRQGHSSRTIGRHFGISHTTVLKILKGV
ncbi:hypothetical protein WH96_06535 [Kiloniella spongiae]|uniref:Resolvase HTH domain-containing protein n=1 Tax=Kiloniella spongiae TaxID=1489064 RepID=A0A0H2MFG4_9PROT|nr:hypothetical protein [Kiloniella spongiae]KLN61304.1 hypothetical protein WH96_06535 [Kiloniella spongiae]